MAFLTVKNLTKVYPPPTGKVLFDINFSLNPKDVVAIIGPSGAGKTTLANILAGLDFEF